MKHTAIAVFIVAMLIGGGCSKDTSLIPTTASKPKIAATILPLADIAKNVAGTELEVATVLPPGASPHTFEPTPEIIKNLQDAKILFVIGHGLDDWAVDLSKNLPGLRLVTVDAGIRLMPHQEAEAIGEHEDEDENGLDPHYWLDAKNGQIIAKNVARAISETWPEKSEAIQKNADSYTESLALTDAKIHEILKDKSGGKLITHHHAWGYFAASYGLVIAGSFEPSPGKNLSPKEMAELEKLIKKEGVKTVFIEPQLSEAVVSSIAQDLKLQIKTIDPEGALFGGGYLEMLEGNAKTIADAL